MFVDQRRCTQSKCIIGRNCGVWEKNRCSRVQQGTSVSLHQRRCVLYMCRGSTGKGDDYTGPTAHRKHTPDKLFSAHYERNINRGGMRTKQPLAQNREWKKKKHSSNHLHHHTKMCLPDKHVLDNNQSHQKERTQRSAKGYPHLRTRIRLHHEQQLW